MKAKKPKELVLTATLMKLFGHAAMGVAMGLGFALVLIVMNPGVATLIQDGGNPVTSVFVASFVLTFGIGATLTGAILMMMEEKTRT